MHVPTEYDTELALQPVWNIWRNHIYNDQLGFNPRIVQVVAWSLYPLRYSGSKHVCERKIIGNIGVDLYLNTMQWRVMGVKIHACRLEN
jgi:hypothetical protein